MNMPRRIFNRYLVTGLAGGACIGFVAGRYGAPVERDTMEPAPATEALRTLAEGAEGVHLIGLSIEPKPILTSSINLPLFIPT